MGPLHWVSLRHAKRATHAAMQVCDRPKPTSKNTPDMAQLNDNKAYEPSLNFEPGCIKVVDTFRIVVGTSGARKAWIGFSASLGPLGGAIEVFGAGRSSPGIAEQVVASDMDVPVGTATPLAAPEPASLALLTV